MKKQNVRTLSLIVSTFTYLLVGAAIFDALESDHELTERRDVKYFLETFKREHNVNESTFEQLLVNVKLFEPHRAGRQWKFAGAFYFATTVITTIGYGHSSPKTESGKIFCMFYALAGIPLTLVMFQSVGERLNTFITFLLRNFKKCFKFKKTDITQSNLICVAMTLSGSVLLGGAYIFSYYEGWEYLNAFYYCFITLTTVGFGDYVALQSDNSLDARPGYVAFGLGFIWFGLTVLAAAMNLMVLRLLTLNTEDERRDELEAAQRARQAVRLDGDIITSGKGSIAFSPLDKSGPAGGPAIDDDNLSVCRLVWGGSYKLLYTANKTYNSCTCYDFGHSLRHPCATLARTDSPPTPLASPPPPPPPPQPKKRQRPSDDVDMSSLTSRRVSPIANNCRFYVETTSNDEDDNDESTL